MPDTAENILPPFQNSIVEFDNFLKGSARLQALWKEAAEYTGTNTAGSSSSRSQRPQTMKNKKLSNSLPMPCILGDTPRTICEFAERFYWMAHLGYSYYIRRLDANKIPVEYPNHPALQDFSYTIGKKKSSASHFCPIAIFRASDQPFGYTTSVVVCLYRSEIRSFSFYEQMLNPTSRAEAKITPVEYIFLPTLQNNSLRKLSKALYDQNINIAKLALLRKLLQEQIYLLYGIVPSFLFMEKRSDHLPTTIQLHPTVAYFWSLGLSHQAAEFSRKHLIISPKPAAGQILTPEETERLNSEALECEEIHDSFVDTLYRTYETVQDSVTGFLTHCCLKPNTAPPTGMETDFANFLALEEYRRSFCLFLGRPLPGNALSFPPVPVLLSPFFSDKHQMALLADGLAKSAQDWLLYAQCNPSCAFFTAALLYIFCGDYHPDSLLAYSETKDIIPMLEDQLLLTLEGPLPPPSAAFSLWEPNSFWQVFPEKKSASLHKLYSRLAKIRRRTLCIVLFDEPRALTDAECILLLSCSQILLLYNVQLPENRPSVSISLRELKEWRDDANFFSDPRFPSQDNLLALPMIANRLINYYTWIEPHWHMLKIHWKASAACIKAPPKGNPSDTGQIQGDTPDPYDLWIKLDKRISLAIKRSKNEPKDILRSLADVARTLFSKRCDEQDLKPYLPYLSMLVLLSQSQQVLQNMTTFPVHNALKDFPCRDFLRVFSNFNRVLPLRKEFQEEIWSYLLNYFLLFCRIHKDADGSTIICQSKEEYLLCTSPKRLGWIEDGKLYLAYDRYWDAFIQTTPWPSALKDCRNRFQREVLQPTFGEALVRESQKSTRWYCRPTIMKDGKQVRIGNFLVLDKKFLDTHRFIY